MTADVEKGWKVHAKEWTDRFNIEMSANEPIPFEEKRDTHYFKLFTLWFTMDFTLIAISTGMSGPLAFNMSFRDTALTAVFFSLLTAIPASIFSTFGATLGFRQMTAARYSFGTYPVCLPILFNAATLTGYLIISNILGAQALVTINPSALSIDGGLVIMALVTLVIIIFGARLMHWFDMYAWIPTLIAMIVAIAYSAPHLSHRAEFPPATPQLVLDYACLMAGFFLPWAGVSADFSVFFSAQAPKKIIFLYTYAGLIIGAVPLLVLGAAIGASMPLVPEWTAAYEENSVGGVLGAMLAPAGHGGKFLLFLLAMSIISNAVGTLYALTLNVQAFISMIWRPIHRIFYLFILTAIIIAVSIQAARSFLQSLNNFLGVIAYWPAPYVAIMLLEHYVIRKGDYNNYKIDAWDTPSMMPAGIAAAVTVITCVAVIVPSMSQIWYEGPIAKHTGDIAFELAFALACILYIPLRKWEIKRQGHW